MLAILGGDEIRGGLKDKQIVIRHENLANAAQHVRSKARYADFDHQCSLVSDPSVYDAVCSSSWPLSFEAHGYSGDASVTYVDREKIHVGVVGSVICGTEELQRCTANAVLLWKTCLLFKLFVFGTYVFGFDYTAIAQVLCPCL